jgi:hypothetical protein
MRFLESKSVDLVVWLPSGVKLRYIFSVTPCLGGEAGASFAGARP